MLFTPCVQMTVFTNTSKEKGAKKLMALHGKKSDCESVSTTTDYSENDYKPIIPY